jgi:hypothetical protein
MIRIRLRSTHATAMRTLKPILATVAVALLAAACNPPPDVPPPRFTPRPPLPPEPVDPYAQSPDPYGNTPPPQQPARPGEYPTATRTANPNEVISPYEPYNVIDIEGFRSGQLARDPSNQQIFRVP